MIVTPFWLDEVVDWDNNKWGQSITGFPKCVQEILKVINPKYAEPNYHAELVTWGEIKLLREKIITYLDEVGVKILYGEPEIGQDPSEGFIISKIFNKNGEEVSLFYPSNTHFHDWYKTRRIDLNSIFPRSLQVAHTALYVRYSPTNSNQLESIIVLGTRESATWLVRDFKNSTFTGISNDIKIKEFFRDNPQYKGIDFKNTEVIYKFFLKSSFDMIDIKSNKIKIYYINSYNNSETDITGILVSAIGFQP